MPKTGIKTREPSLPRLEVIQGGTQGIQDNLRRAITGVHTGEVTLEGLQAMTRACEVLLVARIRGFASTDD